LDTSETLFTLLTVANTCGYDSELDLSSPLRTRIRGEVAKAVQSSEGAREASHELCQYYSDRQQAESSRTLAQYISLALYLDDPPEFAPKAPEAQLPPDARGVIGIMPLVQRFYRQAGLHAIWEQHSEEYAALSQRYHEPLSKMLFDTEIYLKLPSAGYLGHQFTVYLDPMGAPGQTNARNYGSDYYVVVSPGTSPSLKMQQIRHTYLHYLLDPLALKYPSAMKRLDPLLEAVKTAPMDESFKNDTGLLVTECLIRAIEIRTGSAGKTPEADREKAVDDAAAQGFILTRYFYETLAAFEKDPVGLRNAFSDLLERVDVGKEVKRAEMIQFATKADPELLRLSRPMEGRLLITAEQRLATGDTDAAQKFAQEALDERSEDAGRALFILARVASVNKDMEGARNYFLRAVEAASDPKVLAWSHIYLGRIFDLQEDRASALDHYRAALNAGSTLPEAKAAAERGIEKPYEPPNRTQE